MDKVLDRIRKLLALADGQANEHESKVALDAASRLMMQHGIDRDDLTQKQKAQLINFVVGEFTHAYIVLLAAASAKLMGTELITRSKGRNRTELSFFGRPENTAMSADLFHSLHHQCEVRYKQQLPKGMTQAERGRWRKQYKVAFASGVSNTVADILRNQSSPVGESRALVVHRDQLRGEIEEALNGMGMRMKKLKSTVKATAAGLAGYRSGTEAKLQDRVS